MSHIKGMSIHAQAVTLSAQRETQKLRYRLITDPEFLLKFICLSLHLMVLLQNTFLPLLTLNGFRGVLN